MLPYCQKCKNIESKNEEIKEGVLNQVMRGLSWEEKELRHEKENEVVRKEDHVIKCFSDRRGWRERLRNKLAIYGNNYTDDGEKDGSVIPAQWTAKLLNPKGQPIVLQSPQQLQHTNTHT